MNTVFKITTLLSFLIFGLTNWVTAQMVDYDPEFYAANYFELTNLEIPISEIYPGVEQRTGIPVLDAPSFESSSEAGNWLGDNEMVLGVAFNGVVKAYPLRVISWHEVVNDEFAGENVMVTFCALTHTGQAYKTSDSGISAMVFNNNTLIYDNGSRSLWSQMTGQAVSGELAGKYLEKVPVVYTSWKEWRMMHGTTTVLSTLNSDAIDYTEAAYSQYENTIELPFPVSYSNKKLPMKSKVIGLEVDGKYKAYPFSLLKSGNGQVEDYFNGMKVKISFNAETESAYTTDEEGELLPVVVSYWYAWYAHHTDTKIYGFLPDLTPLALLEEE
jgi:hypothetical protein